MNIRTDLAMENREISGECSGVEDHEETIGNVKITRIKITDEKGEKAVGKPVGTYVTLEMPEFSDSSSMDTQPQEILTKELAALLPENGTVLVAGLGNSDITPDALGPLTTEKIFATRHIPEKLAEQTGLGSLRPVCAVTTGVMGKTGMETAEILSGIVKKIKPSAVIAVDALASRRMSRLGCTVQISDTGICPGSGVGNSRSEISEKILGVPVIALGVPTVVDAQTLAADLTGGEEKPSDENDKAKTMMVTPRQIDSIVSHAADFVALSINCALQPHIAKEDIMSLT